MLDPKVMYLYPHIYRWCFIETPSFESTSLFLEYLWTGHVTNMAFKENLIGSLAKFKMLC